MVERLLRRMDTYTRLVESWLGVAPVIFALGGGGIRTSCALENVSGSLIDHAGRLINANVGTIRRRARKCSDDGKRGAQGERVPIRMSYTVCIVYSSHRCRWVCRHSMMDSLCSDGTTEHVFSFARCSVCGAPRITPILHNFAEGDPLLDRMDRMSLHSRHTKNRSPTLSI